MRLLQRKLTTVLLAGLATGVVHISAHAQNVPPPFHQEPYWLDTGELPVPEMAGAPIRTSVVAPGGAPWMQIRFNAHNLGENSYIILTSTEDGGRQFLNAKSMKDWYSASAIFNGGTVNLELFVAPGDRGAFVRIDRLVVGEWVTAPMSEPDIESICGTTDDRVASTDPAVGRILFGGCTAWLTSNGAVLTAGHCTDFDPDRSGPLLPDGVLDLGGVVEFNVPPSQSNGTPVAANPDDQYPIDTSNVTWRFDGSGQGLGKDWSVFAVNPNSNTGLRAHIARNAYYRMTRENPTAGNTIRITGYGVDDMPPGSAGGRNAQNVTEQTHSGPYVAESSSGANFWHSYSVDTAGANSGSPIIWNANNAFAIGIHTNGGCTSTGGSNSGTSFEHTALENAIGNFPGPNTVYADWLSPPTTPVEDGTVLRPYNTVTEAVANVVSGGIVSIVEGNYTNANGNTFVAGEDTKSMTFSVPVGGVTIGN